MLDRNVCRCGTYPRIVQAIKLAASRMRTANARRGRAMSRCPSTTMTRSSRDVEVERYELSAAAALPVRARAARFHAHLRALGGGLLVVASVPDGCARRSPAAAARAATRRAMLAAWLHIDETGRVTGVHRQDRDRPEHPHVARAGGRRRAARAARASTMVMADTDLVPFDAGHVRIAVDAADGAAAGARGGDRARDADRRAAARWQVDRAHADRARTAAIVARTAARSAYGELTRGRSSPGTLPPRRPCRARGAWTVRGTAPQEGQRPRLRHRRASLHAGHRRARACCTAASSVRTATAARSCRSTMPRRARDGGVHGRPRRRFPRRRRADRARRAAARRPRSAPSGACRPASRRPTTLYEHLKKTAVIGGGRAQRAVRPATSRRRAPRAARTFDATYRIPYIAHVPLEPRAAVAEWTDGKLTVWTGTQRPFGVRAELAEAFRMPEERVRVIVPDTARPTAASTPASTRSRRRGWRRPRASR